MPRGVEVGVGYVSIVPSADGFAAKLNKAVDPAKVGRQLGDKIGDGLTRGIDSAAKIDGFTKRAGAEGTKAGAVFGRSFSKAAEVQSVGVGVGLAGGVDRALGGLKTLAFGVAGVGVAAGLMGKSFFDAYSDLNESTSKAQVVFGAGFERVQQFADGAAKSMGASKQQALEAAGTFGNLFRAMGLSSDKSADMSVNMLQLAGDLASFNNADPAEVLESLRSGLVGETEPLRKFGVNINEARIKAEAFRLGLAKSDVNMVDVRAKTIALDKAQAKNVETIKKYGLYSKEAAETANDVAQAQQALDKEMKGSAVELDAGAKAQAAYAIIMRDTSLAQGDYARTAEGAANKQRTLSAEWDNFKARVGEKLAPVGETILGAAETGLTNLQDWFTEHGPQIDEAFKKVKDGFLSVFGPDPVANFKTGSDQLTTFFDDIFGEDKVANFEAGMARIDAALAPVFGEDMSANFQGGLDILAGGLDQFFGEDKISSFEAGSIRVYDAMASVFGPDPIAAWGDGAGTIGQWFGNLGEPLGKFVDLLEAIPSAGEPLGGVIDNIEEIQQENWAGFQQGLSDLTDGFERLGEMFDTLEEPFIWFKDHVLDPIFGTIGDASDKVNGLYDALKKLGSAEFLGELTNKLKNIPGISLLFDRHDAGGVIAGPVGAPRLVVAHGGETVLPTHKPALAALRGIDTAVAGAIAGATHPAAAAVQGPALNIESLVVHGQADPNASAMALARELRRVGFFAGGAL